ncbi:MAG: RraA family protein [Dehalococcoidia bacterium]|jgi:regulator of RNase E activity RraA|nr:RraA family protein [Dehalococcoidia bacterium]
MGNTTGPLSEELLAQLRKIDTPTIANALEVMDIQPRTEGFMRPEVRSISPVIDTVVGYAVTGVISARHKSPSALERIDYYNAIEEIPTPRMVVLHDLDYPETVGSYWGEVQGNIALGLGCVGAVTDGGVRDLKEAEEMGFPFWAKEVLVSHGYVHAVAYNVPVDVGGVYIQPSDLIAADLHGVIQIPIDAAERLPAAAESLANLEAIVIGTAQTPGVTGEKLAAAWDESIKKGAQQSY